MTPAQEAFVDLLVRYEVVRFGDFTLKSGRKSPYFINAGQLRTGRAIQGLGTAYADAIRSAGWNCDLVFGPSYKGVPLAVTTAIALSQFDDNDVPYCFDRKEAKDHGEGGVFVGTKPEPGMRVVLVDDVITSGKSLREAVQLLRNHAKVELAGAVVAVDRLEKGKSSKSTLEELRNELELEVRAIVNIRELVGHLHNRPFSGKIVLDDKGKEAIEEYLNQHGA